MSQPIDTLAIEIEANAANSVDGVRKLTRALTSLSKSISSVNGAGIGNVASSLNSMSNAFSGVGTGSQSAASGAKKYSNTLPTLINHNNKAANSAKTLTHNFGKLYANTFLVIQAFKAFGKTISGTMNYMESFNFWDVSITSATGKTSEWKELGYEDAEAYAQAFKQGLADFNQKMTGFKTDANTGDISISDMPNLGINLTDLTTFQAEIVSITSSLGLCTSVSKDTSKALSMLVADMSSLKNIDLDTVMTNFQSGLIGQSRALYKYGIDITNATLQTYAYQYGIDKAVSEMTQAEKMQLRMLAILDQSKVSWGDLANTLEQPANQFRVLKNGVKNLAITIGKLLMPMVSATLPYLNAMVNALQKFFTWTANILGIELNVENTGAGTTDIFDNIEDSAEDATDAVKKLKNSIRSFDELNVINANTGMSSNNSIGGGVDLSTEISNALAEYEKAWEEAYANMNDKASALTDALVDAFKRKDYKSIGTYISNGLTNALNSINWDTVYSVADQFGTGLAQFLNGLITPEEFGAIGKTVAGALNTAMKAAFSFGTEFDFENAGVSIGTAINRFFEDFDFTLLAKSLSVWADGLLKQVNAAITTIKWSEVASSIAEFISNLELGEISIDLAKLIVNVSEAVFEFAQSFEEAAFFSIAKALGFDFESEKGMKVKEALEVTFDVRAEINSPFSGISDLLDKIFPETHSSSSGRVHGGGGLSFCVEVETNDESFKNTENGVKKWSAITGTIITGFNEENTRKIAEFSANAATSIANWGTETEDRFSLWDKNTNKTVESFRKETQTKFNVWNGNVGGTVSNWQTNTQSMFENWKTTVGAKISTWKSDSESKFNSFKTNTQNTISDWYSRISSFFGFDKWNFSGIKSGLSNAFDSAVSAIKRIWNTFANWLNDKLTWTIDPVVIAGKTLFEGSTISLGKLPTFASGGFPEDGLFMANHNELVGQFSNGRTAVANNRQITEGIADAVYRGNQENNSLMRKEIEILQKQNELLLGILEKETGISSNDLFSNVQKSAREYRRRTGRPAFDF